MVSSPQRGPTSPSPAALTGPWGPGLRLAPRQGALGAAAFAPGGGGRERPGLAETRARPSLSAPPGGSWGCPWEGSWGSCPHLGSLLCEERARRRSLRSFGLGMGPVTQSPDPSARNLPGLSISPFFPYFLTHSAAPALLSTTVFPFLPIFGIKVLVKELAVPRMVSVTGTTRVRPAERCAFGLLLHS